MWIIGFLFVVMSVIEIGTSFWNSSDRISWSNAGLLAILPLFLLDVLFLLVVLDENKNTYAISMVFLIPWANVLNERNEMTLSSDHWFFEILIFVKCVMSFFLSLFFVMRSFLWSQALSFCVLLSFAATLVYFLSRRAKRRAENPMQGLLELPASRRARRNSSSCSGWISDGLMSTLRRNRAA